MRKFVNKLTFTYDLLNKSHRYFTRNKYYKFKWLPVTFYAEIQLSCTKGTGPQHGTRIYSVSDGNECHNVSWG
jgi:hypothetical protein